MSPLLDFKRIEETRAVIEELWPELVHKLPPVPGDSRVQAPPRLSAGLFAQHHSNQFLLSQFGT
jgi:hypothetical protein